MRELQPGSEAAEKLKLHAKNEEIHLAGAEEAAGKLGIWGEICGKHTSTAKADNDSVGLVPGINPRPTARMSFSASC